MIVEFDATLVERAVLIRGGDDQDFRADREGAYRTADPEHRDGAFAAVHERRFVDLDLAGPVHEALREQSSLSRGIERAYVRWVARKVDEGAELFVQPDDGTTPAARRRRLVIRVRAETLVDRESCLALLRRELFHVADMIDPAFGYQPTLAPSPGGPAEDRLVAARYGAAWSATIVGRLVRRGWLSQETAAEAGPRFGHTFPMLGPTAEAIFERLLGSDHPMHLDLAHLAADPIAAAGGHATSAAGSRCSLCQMPAYALATIDDLLAIRIAAEFPHWSTGQPVCVQCGDLCASPHVRTTASACASTMNRIGHEHG